MRGGCFIVDPIVMPHPNPTRTRARVPAPLRAKIIAAAEGLELKPCPILVRRSLRMQQITREQHAYERREQCPHQLSLSRSA
jgi:hypothetical protein